LELRVHRSPLIRGRTGERQLLYRNQKRLTETEAIRVIEAWITEKDPNGEAISDPSFSVNSQRF
jgi:hypothetical protein